MYTYTVLDSISFSGSSIVNGFVCESYCLALVLLFRCHYSRCESVIRVYRFTVNFKYFEYDGREKKKKKKEQYICHFCATDTNSAMENVHLLFVPCALKPSSTFFRCIGLKTVYNRNDRTISLPRKKKYDTQISTETKTGKSVNFRWKNGSQRHGALNKMVSKRHKTLIRKHLFF